MNMKKVLDYIEKHSPDTFYYMNGGCFKFYLILRKRFGVLNVTPYHNSDHVISKIGEEYFDATGLIDGSQYQPMCELWLRKSYWYK